ncbi:MAG: hypothetical protein WBG90_13610 [Saonia sp.]
MEEKDTIRIKNSHLVFNTQNKVGESPFWVINYKVVAEIIEFESNSFKENYIGFVKVVIDKAQVQYMVSKVREKLSNQNLGYRLGLQIEEIEVENIQKMEYSEFIEYKQDIGFDALKRKLMDGLNTGLRLNVTLESEIRETYLFI